MGRWVVFHEWRTQPGGEPVLHGSIVLPDQDALEEPIIYWEAEMAPDAIQKAALQLREGGKFYATNFDTLIVADDVTLEMQAIVPGIRAAGATQ